MPKAAQTRFCTADNTYQRSMSAQGRTATAADLARCRSALRRMIFGAGGLSRPCCSAPVMRIRRCSTSLMQNWWATRAPGGHVTILDVDSAVSSGDVFTIRKERVCRRQGADRGRCSRFRSD
jgi:hypothetical protein